jgi:hypothetical protein
MATQAPPAPTKKPAPKPAEQQPTQPPEDTVWTRYSPHGEMQLSSAGSFALHALGIGIFIMLGLFVYNKGKGKELPVEVVQLTGGGRGAGKGIGDGIGNGEDREDGIGKGDGSVVEGPKDDGQVTLDPEKMKALPTEFKNDPDAIRAIQRGNENVKAMAGLNEAARNKLRSGINPGGNGGTGPGGIQGGNDGDGTGGKGGRAANEREKRMYRWRMTFDRGSPSAYVEQLASMGAILGVPVDADKKDYRVIRDLRKRPAKLLNEDAMKLGLIGWFNSDPNLSAAVMEVMGITDVRPTHFVVFFPLELETQFAKLEADYLNARKLTLKDIDETYYALKTFGKTSTPYITEVVRKPGR